MAITANSALKELCNVLLGIIPGSDNKAEWAAIRIVCQNNLPFLDINNEATDKVVLDNILKQLNATVPGSDNKAEWAFIRQETARIMASPEDTKGRLTDLLTVLLQVVPGSDNTVEWATIRQASQKLINDLA